MAISPRYAATNELVNNALRALIGIPPFPSQMMTDEDARIGRLLMDAILLMESGPNALDDDQSDAPPMVFTIRRRDG